MKFLKHILFVFALCSSAAFAAPANEASIKQLLAVTEARKVVDGMFAQFDGRMNGFLRQALHGQPASPEQQKAINSMKIKMTMLFQQEYSWEELEPMYIRIYKESFSQEEVDGMIAFYKTPSGQAIVKKMPIVMQKTMLEVQTKIVGLMPKLQKIQQEFIFDLQTINHKKQINPPSNTNDLQGALASPFSRLVLVG